MDNFDFIVELFAKLNLDPVLKDYKELQEFLIKNPIAQKVVLDGSVTKQAIKNLASEIHNELGKAFSRSGIESFDIKVQDVENFLGKAAKQARVLSGEIQKTHSTTTKLLSKFNSKTGGVLINTKEFKDVENILSGLGKTHTIADLNTSMQHLETTYNNMVANLRTGSKSLNPFINAINEMNVMDKTLADISVKFNSLASHPQGVKDKISQLYTLQSDVNKYSQGTLEWSKAYGTLKKNISLVNSELANLQNAQKSNTSIGIFSSTELEKQNRAYITKVSRSIAKTKSELEGALRSRGYSDINVSGIEDSSGKIKSLKATVTDANGQIKQLNFLMGKIKTPKGNDYSGFIQSEDVKVLSNMSTQAQKTIGNLNSLKKNWKEQGVLTGGFKDKVVELESALSNVKSKDNLSKLKQDLMGLKKEATDISRNKDVSMQVLTEKNSLDSYKRSLSGVSTITDEIRGKFKLLETSLMSVSNTKGLTSWRKELRLLKSEVQSVTDNDNKFVDNEKRLKQAMDIYKYLNNNTKIASNFRQTLQMTADSMANIRNPLDKNTFKDMTTEVARLQTRVAETDKLGGSFFSKISNGAKKFADWTLASGGVVQAIQSVKKMFSAVIELDAALVELSKVADLSGNSLETFIEKSYEIGEGVSRTGNEIINAVTIFKRAGYELEQSLDLAEASAIMVNIGDNIGSIENASSALISILRGFKKEASEAVDVISAINETSNNAPIDFDNITEGLRRISGTFQQTGTTLEQTIGLLTGGFASLRDIEMVSSGLMMISQRLRGIDEDGQAIDGLAPKLKKSFKEIAQIDIEDSSGELRSTYDILSDYAKVRSSLSSKEQQYLGELSSGNRQVKVFNAIIDGWEDVEKAVANATNSEGSALEENEKVLGSINSILVLIKSRFQNLGKNIFDNDAIKITLKSFSSLLSVFNTLSSRISVIPTFVAHLATAIVGAKRDARDMTQSIEKTTTTIDGKGGKSITHTFDEIKTSSTRASQSLRVLGAEVKKVENPSKLTSFGMSLGQFAINMASSVLITKGIGLIHNLITSEKRANEAARNLRQTTRDNLGTYADEKKELDETINKYKELYESLIKTDKNTQEYIDTKNSLLELQNSLVEKYGDEVKGIDLVTDSLEANIQKYKELNKEKAKDYLYENQKGIASAHDKVYSEDYWTLTPSKYTNKNEAMLTFLRQSGYNDTSIEIETLIDNVSGQARDFNAIIKGTPEELEESLKELYDAFSKWDYESFGITQKQRDNALAVISNKIKSNNSEDLNNAKEIIAEAQKMTLLAYSDLSSLNDNAVVAKEKYLKSLLGTDNKTKVTAKNEIEQLKETIKAELSSVEYTQAESKYMSDYFDDLLDTTTAEYRSVLDKYISEYSGYESQKAKDTIKGYTLADINSYILNGTAPENLKNALSQMRQSMDSVRGSLGMSSVSDDDFLSEIERLKLYANAIQSTFVENNLGISERITQNKDTIAKFRNDIASIDEYINKLSVSSLNADETLELLTKISEIDSNFDIEPFNDAESGTYDFISALRSLKSSLQSDVVDIIGELSLVLSNELLSSYDDLNTKMKNTATFLDDIEKVQSSVANGTTLTNKEIAELSLKYGDLGGLISGTTDAWVLEEGVISSLQKSVEALSSSYIDCQVSMSQFLSSALGERLKQYGIELESVKTLQDVYNQINNKSNLNPTMVGGELVYSNVDDNTYDEQTRKLIQAYLDSKQLSIEAAERIKKLRTNLPSSTSSSSSSSKPWEEELNNLKHALSMDYITEKEYYDKLKSIRDRYTKGNKKYLEDYRGFSEELYSLSQGLFEDSLGDVQHDLNNKIKNGLSAEEQIKVYKDLQDMVHRQADLYRNQGIAEEHKLIQELQNLWWGYKDNIDELQKNFSDSIVESAKNAVSQIDKMLDLLEGKNYDSTKLTNTGSTKATLYAQMIVEQEKIINQAEEEMSKLSATTDSERLNELNDIKFEAAKAIKDYKYNIIDLIKEGYDAEKESVDSLIDAQIELLDAKKENDDYNKTISEHAKTISILQSQIAMLSLSSADSDIAERLRLEQELKETESILAETQQNKELELKKQALQKEKDDYAKQIEDKKSLLEESTKHQINTISNFLGNVTSQYNAVGNTIMDIANKFNISLSDSITTPFAKGISAFQEFAKAVGAMQGVDVEYDFQRATPIAGSPRYTNVTSFSTGGLVGAFNRSGEDGIAFVKQKEIILNQNDSKSFKTFVDSLPSLIPTIKPFTMPSFDKRVNNKVNNVNVNISLENGNFDGVTLKQCQDIISSEIRDILIKDKDR